MNISKAQATNFNKLAAMVTIQFKYNLQLTIIILKMERDEPHKQKIKRDQSESEEASEEEQSESEDELDSFIAPDSEIQEDGDPLPYRPSFSDDEGEGNKSKKERKKEKKKQKTKKEKKSRKRRDQQQSYDVEDLDIIDNTNKLTRLKKKKQFKDPSDEEDYEEDENQQSDYNSEINDVEQYSGAGQYDEEEEEHSKLNEFIDNNKQILDPFDLANMALAQEDTEIIQTDLPQRYIPLLKELLKKNQKSHKKKEPQMKESSEKKDQQIKELFDKDYLEEETKWIFRRLKQQGALQSYDDELYLKRIHNILICYHKQHLEPMYIFLYRKKEFFDYLSLQALWKIIELDQEWHHFRERQKKILTFLQTFLNSLVQVGDIINMTKQLVDTKYLKYLEDFEKFKKARYTGRSVVQEEEVAKENVINQQEVINKKNNDPKTLNKFEFVTQMARTKLIEQIQSSQVILSPQNLCFNLTRRSQERKPRSPNVEPNDQFQRFLNKHTSQSDRLKYTLLNKQNRLKTIVKYVSFDLFSYPELRKILREKYYKKLVITTNPTSKGNQDIDLYSIFFPVKRIRDKAITTLKRQAWILAREAQKLGHIKIDLRFEWQQHLSEKTQRFVVTDRDSVYIQLIKQYYDMASHNGATVWNLFRKKVIGNLLSEYFIPTFMKEIKQDLSREGQKEIIQACCAKFKAQLNKGPSLKDGKPIKILALVLEDIKLGVAFVDQSGKPLHTFQTTIANESQLKDFVGGQNLKFNIKQYKPEMILVAANCKKAQTLRKQLRSLEFNSQSIFCAFGEYEIPRLVAKKRTIQGLVEEESIMQAISMARLKKNPMAEIIYLWSNKIQENGILSMNLHPYQKFINQHLLKQSLQRVIIESVNWVGLDLNDIKNNEHMQNQVQFVSGLGPKKAQHFLERLKDIGGEILNRNKIQQIVKGPVVSKNCASFFKIQTSFHKALLQKIEKQKKGHAIAEYDSIHMLDMTRIPEQWYKDITKKLNQSYKSTTLSEMRSKKLYSKLSQENIYLLQIFKNPERIRAIDWRVKDNSIFDEQLVKNQFMNRFKNPREKERVIENNEIFFNLLRETPETLKRYMVMPVKVLSVKKNYLNVIIPQNGLFGYIKLQSSKSTEDYEKIYEKGLIIKAIIIGFPFDQRNQASRDQGSTQEQQLLKVEMALDFPHKDSDRHQVSRHDCMQLCFPSIVKQLHPIIDLDKDRFELKKEDKPIIQNKEERQKAQPPKNISKPDFRRISHPKFKNISAQPAIQLMKTSSNGDYVIRPSSQGPEYLTITWKFFGKLVVHIKIRCQHRGMNSMNMTYRIEDKDNRSYNSLEDIIEKSIKPMNLLVQDVISNRKFLDRNIEEIENTIKRDMIADSSHIYYYFAVSEDFPQFFLLIYMYKDKKPIRQLIKVKSSGLYFHDQQFSTIRDLIAWFKEHLKEKEYQKYVKTMSAQMQKMK